MDIQEKIRQNLEGRSRPVNSAVATHGVDLINGLKALQSMCHRGIVKVTSPRPANLPLYRLVGPYE